MIERPLLDSVDALTKPRLIHTWVEDDEGERRLHSEWHPSLLDLLVAGTGRSAGTAGSSDPGLPIDADALELWGMVHDLIRLWCKQLGVVFDGDDLTGSTRRWYQAHTNAVRAGKVSETIDYDVTRMVAGWVRMIESKFDPDTKREFTQPCPAIIPVRVRGDNEYVEVGQARCGARRITVGGIERFAIMMNMTQLVAECESCKTKWVGLDGFAHLIVASNQYAAELADTPTES